MELITILLIVLITAALSLVSFILGSLVRAGRQYEREASFALIVAFLAATEAQSLRKSTVIQRIIEKYHPIKTDPEKLSDDAQEVEAEMQALLGDMRAKNKKREEQYEKIFGEPNPDELV